MASQWAQALIVSRHGGPEVLQLAHLEVAPPGPGELLVRLAAAGVNFVDIYQREGVYPSATPFVSGNEGAGTVEAIGDGVAPDEFAVGDTVAWPQFRGSASELVLIPATAVVRVPADLDVVTAAAAMLQGVTAHYLVNSTFAVQASHDVLVHAAAGGVGQLLIQLAKGKGARVIGTVSTEAKAAIARAAGADDVIDYTTETDVAGAVRTLTHGTGVSVVYDGVGRSTFDASLASLKPRGMLVLFGAASGQVPAFEIQRLNAGGSLFLTRPSLGHYLASRAELVERCDFVLNTVASGQLRIDIGGQYPMTEAARAYEDLAGRRTTGKLVLIP